MQSKTSFFNKTIFMKNITRFWAIWAIESMALILIGLLPLYSSCYNIINDEQRYNKLLTMRNVFSQEVFIAANPICIAVLSAIIAILVFSYINNSKDAYMIHSFPIKRETLFISNYLSGLAMMLVPYILYFLILIGMEVGFNLGITRSLVAIMFEGIIQFFLFYSMMCMVMMISGNQFIAAAIYVVLNVLEISITFIFYIFSTLLVYGLSFYDMSSLLSKRLILDPVIYLMQYEGLIPIKYNYTNLYQMEEAYKNLSKFAIYIIPAILFVIAAIYLYKKRASETVGDTLAFKWCKPIFRIVFTITGAPALIMLIMLFTGLTHNYNFFEAQHYGLVMLLIIISSILCYLISDMILNKTFFIWKKTSYAQMGAITAFLLIITSFIHFGMLSIMIPGADKIAAVEIAMHSNEFIYEDKEIIKKVIDTQKAFSVNQNTNSNDSFTYATIQYKLKSGKKIYFSYNWNEGTDQDNINSFNNIISTPQQRVEGIFSTSYKDIAIKHLNIYSLKTYEEISIEKKKSQKIIYNALIKDLLNISHIPNYNDKNSIVEINLSTKMPETAATNNNIYNNQFNNKYIYLSITPEFVNTLKALDELKIKYK